MLYQLTRLLYFQLVKTRASNLILVLVGISWCSGLFANVAKVEVRKVGDASQLEFSGLQKWDYQLRRENNTIVLTVPEIDESSKVKLTTWKDKNISKVAIRKGIDNKDELVVDVSGDKIFSFDYEMEDPPRLLVDFFFDDEPVHSIAEAKESKKAETISSTRRPAAAEFIKIAKNDKKTETSEKTSKNSEIKNNDDKIIFGVYDGGDPEFRRFTIADYEIREAARIASRKNVYIKFPYLIQPNEFLKDLLDAPPIYKILERPGEENKQAQLLKVLYDNNRLAVFIKTLEMFREKYAKSRYNHILRYMEADVYFKLWREENQAADFQKAMALYRNLLKDYPNSPLTERTNLLIAYSYLGRGDNYGALKSFLLLYKKKTSPRFQDDLGISIADTFREIKKYDEAIKQYELVESTAEDSEAKMKAAYKIGDIYSMKSEFGKPLEAYQRAFKKYPKGVTKFPNAFYNTAESYFWLGKYKKALDAYVSFLRTFPLSSHGGYAMARVGETLEILGADDEKIKGAFNECVFRYQGSPGADVANVRSISKRIPNMKDKEVEVSLANVKKLIKESKLPEFDHFATTMMEEGFYRRGDLDRSFGLLVDFYKGNLTSKHLDFYKSRIVRNITKQVANLVERKNYIEALRVYGKYSGSWLKGDDRIDLRYNLGKSFEISGVPKEAEKIYKSVINRLYAIENTQEAKERKIFEDLPSINQLRLRLGVAYYMMDDFKNSLKFLTEIKNDSDLENSELVEKVQVLSHATEKVGNIDTALNYLTDLEKKWKGTPVELAPIYLRKAELLIKKDQLSNAIVNLEKINVTHKDTKLVNNKMISKALELRGDIYLKKKQFGEAIKTYSNLLSEYEDKLPLESVRYRLGMIHFQRGDLKEAEKEWVKLENKKQGEVWHKLAMEKLENAKWSDEYKRYIDRRPATNRE